MILARLDLTAYGRFTDLQLDLSAGPRRFHLVFGPNESGKSTSLRAITSLLYGIPHITDDNYLHANPQLRIGGLLIDGENQLDCVRRKGQKATLRRTEDDEPIDETVLESLLGGVDRETFLSRFGLSHQELVTGGAAILSGEGDLGQLLFSAGAGIGRLRDIQQELDETAASLFTPRGTKTAIAKALAQLDEQRVELRRAQVPPAEYRDLRDRRAAKTKEAAALNTQIEECVAQHNRLRQFQQALPLIPAWRSTIKKLAECQQTPRLDDGFTERRRQAIADREVARSRRTELQGRITEMNSRLEDLPIDEAILRHQTDIQALFQEVAARTKAERDREGLIRNRNNLDRKIAELLKQLSAEIPSDHAAEHWPEMMEQSIEKLKVSDSSRSRIRQLAASYEKLLAQRNDASDLVESTQRRLADVTEELEVLGKPNDPIVIANAIDVVGNPQAMLEAVTEQREASETLQQRCHRLLRRLDGFEGQVEEAVELALPAPSRIRSLTENITRAQREVEKAREQRNQAFRERDSLAQQIHQQQADQPLPTTAALQQARDERDAIAARLLEWARQPGENPEATSELTDTVAVLCQQIAVADQIADTIRTHHQQIHEREQAEANLTEWRRRCEKCDADLRNATEQWEAVSQAWQAEWRACGVVAAEPERMQRWLTDHETLCETFVQWRDCDKRLDQLQQRIAVASARLSKALSSKSRVGARSQRIADDAPFQTGLFDEVCDDDLISLYDEALAARSEATQQQQHFETLRRRREELSEALPQAETRLEAAQRQVEQWREEWSRTTESFTTAQRLGTDEVLVMLDQISDLHSKKRERDILVRRIQSIRDDEAEFQARADQLVAATGVSLNGPLSATAIAQELYQRLQTTRTSAQTRDTLREQIELSKQRVAEAQAQQKASESVLEQLCHEAGCETPDQLPEIERASRERTQLEAQLRDLENQLCLLAADTPLEAFIDDAGSQQPHTLQQAISDQEVALQQLRDRQTELQQQIGAVQHELQKIDGSGRASELVQSIEFTAGELTRDCEDYARSKIASLILRKAIDHYQQAHQNPILQHATKYFSQLTCHAYRELRPDYDTKGRTTLFGIQADGAAVPAANMSDGTADALYLALRLASLEYQIGLSKPIPLVIDDCLIQLDDTRAVAALQAFSDLSETTQVILFTHHQHIIDLAKANLPDDAFHAHQLGV